METTDKDKVKKKLFYKIGIGLVILGCLGWLIVFIIPFTSLPIQSKAIIIPVAIIFAEAMFWVGALLVGKEIIAKYKSYLNPKNWRKKQKNDEGQD